MNIITLDYESFFSDDFTLSRGQHQHTTEEYIRSPRFEAHGLAIKWSPEHKAIWYTEPQWREVIPQVDWSKNAVLSHHAHFDVGICSMIYGVRPAFILDTLSMARQQLGNHLSVSLDNVRQHYGMPFKRTPYDKFKGKHWHEMSPDVQAEVAAGACDEVESIWALFNIMARDFPAEMYPWVDNTVRMFTEPKLVGDIDMLGEVWMDETTNKRNLLASLGFDVTTVEGQKQAAKALGSDDVFAGMLRAIGVEPEQKAMKDAADGSPRSKYAFAKTDPFMQELVDDPDDNARALAEARLSVKSTLQQTRSERLGYMASRGSLCVYLSAFGAHTNRDSGGDKLNFQNFTRGSKLRRAIKPPKGWLAAKVDKSQIEFRFLMMFAGQMDVIDQLRRGEDPYIGIASEFYGRQITKADEAERGLGKQLKLSCGYGAGGLTIVATARKGTYGPAIYLTDEEGEQAKVLYRNMHPAVAAPKTGLWAEAGRMISAIGGTNQPVEWGCVEVHTGQIIGPNGTRLRYPELDYDNETREWRYKTRRGTTKLYGAKLIENLIQWLAWMAFAQDIVRIGKESGYWPVVREHDAGTWLIPDDQYAEQTLAYFVSEMSRPPAWMPEIPLDAEGSLSEREVS